MIASPRGGRRKLGADIKEGKKKDEDEGEEEGRGREFEERAE